MDLIELHHVHYMSRNRITSVTCIANFTDNSLTYDETFHFFTTQSRSQLKENRKNDDAVSRMSIDSQSTVLECIRRIASRIQNLILDHISAFIRHISPRWLAGKNQQKKCTRQAPIVNSFNYVTNDESRSERLSLANCFVHGESRIMYKYRWAFWKSNHYLNRYWILRWSTRSSELILIIFVWFVKVSCVRGHEVHLSCSHCDCHCSTVEIGRGCWASCNWRGERAWADCNSQPKVEK